eukprot:symbB.v1.2.015753.t2/scaffold1187.1/size155418/2
MEMPFTRHCGTRIFPMSWGGSHWHHDFDDDEVKETMQRRKERFLSPAQENIVFIRAVNCTEELLAIPHLVQALKRRFSRSHVRLLVLVDHQDVASNSVAKDLGNDVIFSTANGSVWESFLNILMRTRMEWASESDAHSIRVRISVRRVLQMHCHGTEDVDKCRWLQFVAQFGELQVLAMPICIAGPKVGGVSGPTSSTCSSCLCNFSGMWEAFRGRRVPRVPAAYATFQAARTAAQLRFPVQAAVVIPQNHWIAGGHIVRRQ